MIDQQTLDQVRTLFAALSTPVVLRYSLDAERQDNDQLLAFLNDFVSTSSRLSLEEYTDAPWGFELVTDHQPIGVRFRGIPNGHEFTSLLMAVFNANGMGKNLPDEALTRRIKAIKGGKLTTYVSLTCTNCPDVVQTLNMFALLNPHIEHEMVDGALFQDEVAQLNIQGVPAVFVDGEMIHSGKATLTELLDKVERTLGTEEQGEAVERSFDLLVLGGGPAGIAAAVYAARKGLEVAVVAERIGGQVNDTTGIENLISVSHTTGTQLAIDLRTHAEQYPIALLENRRIVHTDLAQPIKTVKTNTNELFKAPAVIIATGAQWRRLGLEHEDRLIGRGVHFCPHCDGPFYKDKEVAVIGGGNSGVEAAIDLAGICRKVTVLEFADRLLADDVLQEKLQSMPNTEVHRMAQTVELRHDGQSLTGLVYKDRNTEQLHELSLDGIFVQIGLAPVTALFADQLALSPRKEIVIDHTCRTSLPGVYAAGDATTVPYKQIVVAMGEGAKAALSAFEDQMRGVWSRV